MADHHERRSSPDPRRNLKGNNLRIDLYNYLKPQIIRQDQSSGAQGYIFHWNDPDARWNKEGLDGVWNAVGLAPHIQTLFWVLEKMTGEELDVLESLDSLVDPLNCPEGLLDDIAASFGYRLKEDLSEETKRVVVQGLFHAYKSLGQRVGFDVFYRMVGFQIIKVFPLWKKDINESNNEYSRLRYTTTTVTGQVVGPAGFSYKTNLGDPPIQPGSLRLTDGVRVLKDQPAGFFSEGLAVGGVGTIIGPNGDESGTVDYVTGAIEVNMGATPAVADLTATYEQVTEEFPYHAARMDIEILMNPAGTPIPLVDDEVLRSILDRLDEVRPIHVLLRALTLAFELSDEVNPGATDATACTQILEDSRDGGIGGLGREFRYLLDESPNIRSDELLIEHESGGTPTQDMVLEDRTGMVCPGLGDILKIKVGTNPEELW